MTHFPTHPPYQALYLTCWPRLLIITFYFICIFTAQLLLEDAKNYTFMTTGGLRVPGIDDIEEFTATQNAMKVMLLVLNSTC
jgi:hypothetical protein